MSRRTDSPIVALPKLTTSVPRSNNVLGPYVETFGPSSWISTSSVAAYAPASVEEVYIGQTMSILAGLNGADYEPHISMCTEKDYNL